MLRRKTAEPKAAELLKKTLDTIDTEPQAFAEIAPAELSRNMELAIVTFSLSIMLNEIEL